MANRYADAVKKIAEKEFEQDDYKIQTSMVSLIEFFKGSIWEDLENIVRAGVQGLQDQMCSAGDMDLDDMNFYKGMITQGRYFLDLPTQVLSFKEQQLEEQNKENDDDNRS